MVIDFLSETLSTVDFFSTGAVDLVVSLLATTGVVFAFSLGLGIELVVVEAGSEATTIVFSFSIFIQHYTLKNFLSLFFWHLI